MSNSSFNNVVEDSNLQSISSPSIGLFDSRVQAYISSILVLQRALLQYCKKPPEA